MRNVEWEEGTVYTDFCLFLLLKEETNVLNIVEFTDNCMCMKKQTALVNIVIYHHRYLIQFGLSGWKQDIPFCWTSSV